MRVRGLEVELGLEVVFVFGVHLESAADAVGYHYAVVGVYGDSSGTLEMSQADHFDGVHPLERL